MQVGCFRRDSDVLVEIRDEGGGVPPEHREKIFERSYRIDPARSQVQGGAGLGLAIARLSVGQIGGTVALEETSGPGSFFRITLPVGS